MNRELQKMLAPELLHGSSGERWAFSGDKIGHEKKSKGFRIREGSVSPVAKHAKDLEKIFFDVSW